ncbi:MAG: hypothetical protein IPM13_19205 [Phycisphaerales bacterium]|nr:hypothetical protein [Phycisphaerales bacterium]
MATLPFRVLSLASLALAFPACSSKRSPATVRATGETGVVGRHVDHAAIAAGQVPMSEALAHGRLLFTANFNTLDGGGRPETTGTGAHRARRKEPQNFNRLSAPDANSCAGCHNAPFIGGGGDNVANVFVLAQRLPHLNFDGGEGDGFGTHKLDEVANERNTLGMFGAGYIELLSREITGILHALRTQAEAEARVANAPVTKNLVAKGISYGSLIARPDGTFDTAGVQGVDTDLVIRPFHQKGVVVSLREFTNNAMNHHHGIQSVERFGKDVDADRNDVFNELSDGDITAASLFQATLPAPGRVLPSDPAMRAAVERGEALFAQIGCASCHVPELRLLSPIFSEPNPYNPAGNMRVGDGPSVEVDLTRVGDGPHLTREDDGSVVVRAYTDLKRHDMGPQLNNEKVVQGGVPTSHFLTKKLWGMANEPPFMHHGRALTLDAAIRLHGGEADAAQVAYAALSEADRASVVEFLQTLQVHAPGSPDLVVEGPATARLGDDPAVPTHLAQSDIEAGAVGIDALFAHGKLLFGANFNELDGAGRPASTGTGAPRPIRTGVQSFNRLSGPDANSCAGCHNMPGPGGGGDNVANVFVLAQRLPHVNFDAGPGDGFVFRHLDDVGNERNTLGMWGAGYVELLAREMTRELHGQRDAVRQRARDANQSVRVEISAKGVSFGAITAHADGSLDLRQVVGIDFDLVMRPFHQKGVVVSLREFTNNAMNHHHGIQTRERFGAGVDADQDGMADELTEGDVTAVSLFQAMLQVPKQVLPSDPGARRAVELGEVLFSRVGCASCHVPSLPLDSAVFSEPNPFNPPGNQRLADVSRPVEVDLNGNGPGARLAADKDGRTHVPLFSDLKRHYLGPECDNEKLVQANVATGLFLTKKLWGFASEPPFMHHGRALTITEAIEMHGGEANDSRAAFRLLSPTEKAAMIDFLKTLQVE